MTEGILVLLQPALGDDTADGLDPWRAAVILSGLLVLAAGSGVLGALWLAAVTAVLHRTRTRRTAWKLRAAAGPPAEQMTRQR